MATRSRKKPVAQEGTLLAVGEKARPPSPARCRRMIRERLAESLDSILQGFIEQAKDGGSQHMKTTAELLDQKKKPRAAARPAGTVQRLLKEAQAWEQRRAD